VRSSEGPSTKALLLLALALALLRVGGAGTTSLTTSRATGSRVPALCFRVVVFPEMVGWGMRSSSHRLKSLGGVGVGWGGVGVRGGGLQKKVRSTHHGAQQVRQ
jgi:hypothetical protein